MQALLSRWKTWSPARQGVAITVVFVAIIALITSCGGADDQPPTASTPRSTVTDAAPAASEQPDADPRLTAAKDAEVREDYDEAIRLYDALGEEREVRRLKRAAARVLVARARDAYRDGRYRTARTIARRAIREYGRTSATGAATVSARASTRIREASARRARRAELARIRRAQARERRRQEAAAAAAADAAEEEAASAGADAPHDGNPYPGMNCTEIGHSYTVVPGSDPDHDADNDGVACESQ